MQLFLFGSAMPSLTVVMRAVPPEWVSSCLGVMQVGAYSTHTHPLTTIARDITCSAHTDTLLQVPHGTGMHRRTCLPIVYHHHVLWVLILRRADR